MPIIRAFLKMRCIIYDILPKSGSWICNKTAVHLTRLAIHLGGRFERIGQLKDLEEAIQVSRRAVEITPENSTHLAGRLDNLGSNLTRRFERLGRLEDLEEAIRVNRRSAEVTPEDSNDLAGRQINLAVNLASRFNRLGGLDDLEEAIQVSRRAVEITLEDSTNLGGRLHNLGAHLGARFDRLGQLEDLEEAIQVSQRAIKVMPEDSLHFAFLLNSLAINLDHRFKRLGRLEDLEEAIQLSQRAIKVTPEYSVYFPDLLNVLTINIGHRFHRLGQLEDLEDAIRVSRRAVDMTPRDSIDLGGRLNTLALNLGSRFDRLGQLEDLEDAIRVSRRAMDITPRDSIDLGGYFTTLASNLERRFKRQGQLKDLEGAIRLDRQALDMIPENSAALVDVLNNLAGNLGSRFEKLGQLQNLEEAIQLNRRAVHLTPEDNKELAGGLNNLAIRLGSRYETLGRLEDLEEAIHSSRQAVEVTPKHSVDLVHWLNNLGCHLRHRFERLGQLRDLEEAIQLNRQAVLSTLEDSVDLAARLTNLAINLNHRFKRLDQREDLEEAIQLCRQAVELTHEDDTNLAIRLSNLGNNLELRFKCLDQLEDLEEAIRVSQRAVDITPVDSKNLGSFLLNLGSRLGRRVEHSALDDLQETAAFRKAWQTTNAIPIVRLRAAKACVACLCNMDQYDEAGLIAADALHLLPTLITRALSYQDRQDVVVEFSSLASDACALRLQTGSGTSYDAEKALELLEVGRGSLLGLAFEDRIDLAPLQKSYPQHVTRLQELRAMLNPPSSVRESSTNQSLQLSSPFQILGDFHACIEHIRSLHGFERFMTSPNLEEMKAVSTDGTIILVNVSTLRSDAIIVTPKSIRSVYLQDLKESRTRDWIKKFQKWSLQTQDLAQFGIQNNQYRIFLHWLWRSCVKKVFDELGYSSQPDIYALPRVRWIGAGLASSLPFHAAGRHFEGSTSTTFNRAVSSYVPTIRALIYAKTRAVDSVQNLNDRHSLLIATMETTPGQPDLKGAPAEASAIQQVVANACRITHHSQPNAEHVLQHMSSYDMFHFAGHGVSDAIDAGQSSLIFEKVGSLSPSMVQDRFRVARLFEVNFQPALLAFLSACCTAENRDERLADESIHLGNGFLVAGYRHVIGCLWQSDDQVCVDVASDFYRELNIKDGINDASFARALHIAVSKAYETLRGQPLSWAQYIHIGA